MDISLAIKTTYFQALNGNVSAPIYEAFAIPENASYPYVIISSITASERLPNGCRIYNVETILDVVTGFASPKGSNDAFIITEQITDIIWPLDLVDLDATDYGWKIGETRLIGATPLQLRTDNYWIYRNLLTFSHIVYPI